MQRRELEMKAKARSTATRDLKDRQEQHAAVPDVARLMREFDYCVNRREGSYWTRRRRNYDARRCLWPNKTGTGRKPKGRQIFPWSEASDMDVPLTDKYIREDVALLMNLWTINRVMVKPTQPSKDAGWANRTTQFLRWLIYEHIEEGEDEAELAANLYLERGAVGITVVWDRTETLVYEELDFVQIQRGAQAAAQRMRRGDRNPSLEFQAQLPAMILDPSQDANLVELIAPMLGDAESVRLDRRQLLGVIKQLRTEGKARFPKIDILRDRPTIGALALNEDLWLPPECSEPQKARSMFRVELLTETGLQERIRTAKWDANWVDEMVETQRGRMSRNTDPKLGAQRVRTLGGAAEDARLFEVVHAYERQYDSEGVPAIWYTCCSRGVEESVAASDLLNYAHGLYPFVVMGLERRSRSWDDSRGYGERAEPFQRLIKTEWDSRIDRASLATLPPSYHPPNEAPDEWGPGVKVPTRRPDAFGFLQGPKYDAGSREVEEGARRFADEYFGRPVDEQNRNEATLLKQELVRGWMKGWKRVYKQVLQLCQQFSPDEFYYRVVGDEQGRLLHATRDDIQGQFNVVLTYNVRDLDPEYVQSKLALMEKVAALDRNGRLDPDEMLRVAFELIDPGYGERLLRPGEEASANEIDDEKRALSQMLVGVPVDIKPGQAFGLRLQTLMQLVQKSQTVQFLLKSNPEARALVETRAKQLKHQLDQKQNAQTGRFLGTQPMAQVMSPEPKDPLETMLGQAQIGNGGRGDA